MKQLLPVLFFMSFALSCFSQCECTDCPVFVPDNTTVTSTLNISGSTNPTLAINGQSLCQICMDFTSDAIDELNVSLQSPSGSNVLLFSNTGLSVNQGINFDICFVSCIDTPIPDAGFPNNFATDEGWQAGSSYSGSYYPENACLEDFNGDINGDWILTLTDNFGGDPSDLLDWYLVFSDDSGLSCANAANCAIASICLAEGGNIDEISFLEEMGSPNLNLSLTTTYAAGESPAPSSDYTYYYLVFSEAPTSELIAVLTNPDLTGYSSGEYQIYGLSILDSEFGSLPLPNTGVSISNILNDITNETYCADLDDTGVIVTIDDCLANGGTLESANITAPEGDPTLITSWLVDFSGTNTPPAPAYELQYIVLEAGTDNIVAYLPNQDFTSLPPGMYQITAISYLVSDAPLLPPPGNGAFLDLINLINSNSICAIYFGLNDVNITFNCQAEGGLLSGAGYIYCVNDPLLDLSFPPVYNGGNVEPSGADYSYIYVVSQDGVIIDFDMNTDYTLYAPGTYEVCGLSYLNADASLLPVANGVLTINDIQLDIDNDLYCADISDNCVSIFIQPEPDPLFIGDETVCAGEEYIYTNVNFDPDALYLYNIQSGSFSQFIPSSDGTSVSVIWNAGFPGAICLIEQSSACGNEQSCINVTVNGGGAAVNIDGETNVCIDATEVYTLTPFPTAGQQYTATIMGGTIISIIDDQVTVQWDNTATGELCVTLDDPVCNSTEICITVNKIPEVNFPSFTLTAVNCQNSDVVFLTSPVDPDILNFFWTTTNATITDVTSDFVVINFDQLGIAEVCLEIETACGFQGPVCQSTEIFEVPTPVIDPIIAFCGLTITLSSTPFDISNSWLWTSPSSGTSISYSDQTNFATDVTFNAPGTYTFNLQEFGSNCIGLDNIEITVTDGLDISTVGYTCNLNNEYELSFDILSGTSPYTVDGTTLSGNTFTSTTIPSGSNYSYSVEDADGCTAIVSGDYLCPCISSAGTMSNILLETCATDGSTVTATNNGSFLDSDDIGYYYLHDASGDFLGNIFDSNNIGVFTYTASLNLNQTYYISYVVGNELTGQVDLNDPCLSVAIGQEVIFYGDPNIDFLTNNITCGQLFISAATSSADITTIQWQQINGPGQSTFSNSQIINPTITVDVTGFYEYEVNYSNGFCSVTSTVIIEYLGQPIIINPEEECTNAELEYILTFEVENVIFPLTANIPGTFSGNVFTSDPIPSGVSYQVTVTNGANCDSDVLQGIKLCDCISEAGTMSTQNIQLCGISSEAIASSNDDFILDNDDDFVYILHTQSAATLGTIIQISATGIFSFDNSLMLLDQTYYMSLAVANSLNGSIDLDDPCLDIASGQAVIWNAIPDITLPEDISTCADIVSLDASPQTGQWSIIDAPSNAMAELTNSQIFNTNITIEVAGDYAIQWTTDNNGCVALDTLIITKNESPLVDNVLSICNEDLNTYDLSFNIIGAESEYTINGNSYTSTVEILNIPTGQTDTFTIVNANGCEEQLILGPVDCSCISAAGTLTSSDTIALCSTIALDVNISTGDYILDQNDTIAYVLMDNNQDDLNGILVVSYGESIDYQSIWQQYEILYLAVVVTDYGNDLDLTDPCLSISDYIPIIWTETTSINFDFTYSECENNIIKLNPIDSNLFPIQLTFEDNNGVTFDYSLSSLNDSIEFIVIKGTTDLTLINTDKDCIDPLVGSITIEGVTIDDPVFDMNITLCNNPLTNATLVLDSLFNGSVFSGIWTSDNIPIIDNAIVADNIVAGTYEVLFDTRGTVDPCEGTVYSIDITVIDCPCPTIILPPSIDICLSNEIYQLSEIYTDLYEVSWRIVNINNLSNPPTISDDEINLLNSSAGTYELQLLVIDELPQGCDINFVTILNIETINNSGIQQDITTYCQDDEGTINLFDQLSGATPGGLWSTGTSIVNITDLEIGLSTYIYTIANSTICPSSATEIFINIEENPILEIDTEDVFCYGEESGIISLEIVNDNGQNYVCQLDETILEDGKIIEGLAAGTYDILVSSEIGCTTLVSDITISEPNPISVTLGEDQEIEIGDTLAINAIINFLESDIGEITWSDFDGIIENNDLSLIQSYTNDNTLTIEISDENGCIAVDQINITTLPQPEIDTPSVYIPNVFNPSQNGENTTFKVYTKDPILIESLLIFDRWGNRVFAKYDFINTNDYAGWDGTFKNQYVSQGVYVYVLSYSIDNRLEVIKGDITLLR